MGRTRKSRKATVAWLCVMAMLTGLLSGSAGRVTKSEAAGSEFTEYTFRDFGIEDQTVSGDDVVSSTGLSSWDKVALSGKVKMPGTGTDDHYIRIAGCQIRSADNAIILENYSNGSTIENSDGNKNGWVYIPTADGDVIDSTKTSREIPIRITTEIVGTNFKVSVTVDGTNTGYITFQNISTDYNIVIRGRATSPVSVISNEKQTTEYAEYTFRDFGIEDQTVSGDDVVSSTGLSSWDKVALSGKVKMPGTGTDDHYIRIAGCQIRSADNAIILENYSNGSTIENSDGNKNGWVYIPTADGDVIDSTKTSREIPIRITTEIVGTNFKVSVTVDGTNTGYITFQNISTDYNIVIRGRATSPVSVISNEKEDPEPATFTEYTFEDFGIKDQTISNGTTIDKDTKLTSWDKVAISGKVTFPGVDAGDHYIRFGSWGGLSIRASETAVILEKGSNDFGSTIENSNKDGKDFLYIDTGEKIADTSIDLRVAFEHVNKTQLKMTVTVNGTYSGYMIFEKQSSGNFNLLIYAGDGRSITIGTPQADDDQDEVVFDEYTLSDFGIKNQIVESGVPVRNAKQPIRSWDDIAISGIVTFPASADSYLRFGTASDGWTGLGLRWADGGHLALTNDGFSDTTVSNSDGNTNGWVMISKSALGCENTIAGQELSFRLTFRYVNDEKNILVSLTVTGKDNNSATVWMKVERPDAENYGILAYGGGGDVNIASAGTTPVEPEIPDPISETPQKSVSSYKEITFKDFLMQDRIVVGDGVQGSVGSLNGKVFKGKVTFPKNGDGHLRIGGTEDNEWFGIVVAATKDNLQLSEAANGRQMWNISKDKIGTTLVGKEMELWLTFTQVDDHNVYVGVYVNGTFCGEKLYKNLQEPFGGRLLVYSEKTGIKIGSVDTAWTRLLKSGVNFAYWGFTDNWKQELAKICR